MKWSNLLSPERLEVTASKSSSFRQRSDFEKDYDRIIFSYPFRKLQDKTQVFPLPDDDFVHTRLTHSLEVSSVGRSLGKIAGERIIKKYPELKKNYTVRDFGDIVGAACLAHDIGNPPFGHSGEEAISIFFKKNINTHISSDLNEKQVSDLTHFEGNAQGFRILNNKIYKGFNLTFATLGAFTKYPVSSFSRKDPDKKSQQKYGFFQAEFENFKTIAESLQLIPLDDQRWSRHPLAFLVEAADDICYHIIDLEDACRLKVIPYEEFKSLLSKIIDIDAIFGKVNFNLSFSDSLGLMRAKTINELLHQCVELFINEEESILNGAFDLSITSNISSSDTLKKIMKVSRDKIYNSRIALQKEISGYRIIEVLLEEFIMGAYNIFYKKQPIGQSSRLMSYLSENTLYQIKNAKNWYESLLSILDFISGLTDSHAIKLYRTIMGIDYFK